MKTYQDIQKIINNISYKDWQFRLFEKGDGFLFQTIFNAPCSITGKMMPQHCRKWYISSHVCDSEVVQTVFKAILAAEEHEVKENFKYKGVQIYDPHIAVDLMHKVMLAGDKARDTRNVPFSFEGESNE